MSDERDLAFGDVNRFRIPPESVPPQPSTRPLAKKRRSTAVCGEFLRGPIPMPWLSAAARLPGKSLAVALAVRFAVGLKNSNSVRLTTAILERFSVSRKAKYAALKALERAGLIQVRREPRKNPTVTILDVVNRPTVPAVKKP